MDVDMVEENEASYIPPTVHRSSRSLPVDDAHPFDIEGYASSYSGRSKVDRLLPVISLCPAVANRALHIALKEVAEMRDPALYHTLISTYEGTAAASDGQVPPIAKVDTGVNLKWADEVTARNQAERQKLEVELKTYTSNMIKESIRMAHRDLGNFFRETGDYASALKQYTKSREFCTTSQHVLDTCLAVLELLIEQRNYAHISTYVFKADAALDATSNIARINANAPTAPAAAASAAGKEKMTAEREKVQSKLDIGLALAHLGQGSYEKAAQSLLKVGANKNIDWFGKLIAPGDIAIYATLCALASYSRPALRSQVLDNDAFGVYMQEEPYVRELLEAYMTNNFKDMLALLERHSTRHTVDVHLGMHIAALTNHIRSRALVLYFQPFASIRLERMGAAFGWTVEELEQHVVNLIQSGEIQARVDRQNKILKAKETDQRAALFDRAIKSGQSMQSTNRKLLLRMKLQQADLVVKAPRGGGQSLTEGLAGDMMLM